ncbi:MAG: TM2 domain-containing protein [Spirochaetaceae bacterium]|nr:MAG: TM2 domain-containing protein [Spirochaetaceae bacterium]
MADVVKKDKSWIATLLLSILIGSLGIDRFFMGYIGLGILKLITLGGFGIWWLIDVILIASKHNFAKVNWVE